MTLIDKINKFEAGSETVESFNTIFKVPLNFSLDEIVTIGEICSPETRRELKIGDKNFVYDFQTSGEEISHD